MGEIDTLKVEIAAYDAMKAELIKHHLGKFVVFFGGELIGAYDSFDAAAREAITKYDKGPYLIREVTPNDNVMPMPASVAFRPLHASN